jgi:hypothetical protein
MSKNIQGLVEILNEKQEIHVGFREIFIGAIAFTISFALRPLLVAIYDKIFGLNEKECPIIYNLFFIIFIVIVVIIFEKIYKANFKTEDITIAKEDDDGDEDDEDDGDNDDKEDDEGVEDGADEGDDGGGNGDGDVGDVDAGIKVLK